MRREILSRKKAEHMLKPLVKGQGTRERPKGGGPEAEGCCLYKWGPGHGGPWNHGKEFCGFHKSHEDK
jgi:hypothetical protein